MIESETKSEARLDFEQFIKNEILKKGTMDDKDKKIADLEQQLELEKGYHRQAADLYESRKRRHRDDIWFFVVVIGFIVICLIFGIPLLGGSQ